MAVRYTQSDQAKSELFPQLECLINIINKGEANSTNFQHASNLLTKIRKTTECNKVKALAQILPKYIEYHEGQMALTNYTELVLRKRVELLEKYYACFDELKMDDYFSSQGKFRSTILEEFMCYMFLDYVKNIKERYNDPFGSHGVLYNGASKSYTNMYIAPTDIEDFIRTPQMGVNEKDQDYAIFRKIKISIEGAVKPQCANIPILAIENKTFLDKTMLDGAIATADKVKAGNPYALYLVVTETYDVNLDVDPVYSRIDQIYVLRKCKRDRNNHTPAPIDPDIVIRMFNKVKQHLERPWSKIQQRLEAKGEIMF